MAHEAFFTFQEYMKKEADMLTASLEDYMEMIYRLCAVSDFLRINELADALNVQPSSVTKAMQKLSELQLIHYEKYGVITLTDSGRSLGAELLNRHETIEAFLRILGIEEDCLLAETEKMEHTISGVTVSQIEILSSFFSSRSDVLADYKIYKRYHGKLP